MVFVVESIIACIVFTLFVFLMSRDPVKTIFNYPRAIIERCEKLDLTAPLPWRWSPELWYMQTFFASLP